MRNLKLIAFNVFCPLLILLKLEGEGGFYKDHSVFLTYLVLITVNLLITGKLLTMIHKVFNLFHWKTH